MQDAPLARLAELSECATSSARSRWDFQTRAGVTLTKRAALTQNELCPGSGQRPQPVTLLGTQASERSGLGVT